MYSCIGRADHFFRQPEYFQSAGCRCSIIQLRTSISDAGDQDDNENVKCDQKFTFIPYHGWAIVQKATDWNLFSGNSNQMFIRVTIKQELGNLYELVVKPIHGAWECPKRAEMYFKMGDGSILICWISNLLEPIYFKIRIQMVVIWVRTK